MRRIRNYYRRQAQTMNWLKTDGRLFYIETARTCYVFSIEHGYAEHLYYGAKIPYSDCNALREKRSVILVNTLYPSEDPSYSFDCKGFEFSLPFRGDSRSASVNLVCDDKVFDFEYEGYEKNFKPEKSPMPLPRKYDYALNVRFNDRSHEGVSLETRYLISYDEDVIARYCVLINESGKDIKVLKFSSAQTDMSAENKKLITFHGAWGREMSKMSQDITCGRYTHGSFSGMSSAECNPLFFVSDANAGENSGEVYGFNLMYSASHEISAEKTPYGGLRILHGIQSENLSYTVPSGEKFTSPCSLSTYSDKGFNGASENFHRFVSKAVLRKKEIPVMLNTWEAVYFSMNEDKMKKLADNAAAAGFECLVIDDGWFSGRNDDTTSLGDWREDIKKFPGGMKALSSYFASKGLKTGIWIEPEMISRKSYLFRTHSEYALADDRLRPVVGRSQYILDLTNSSVAKYVEESVSRLVEEYGAGYVKWDFNRRFAEVKADKGSGYFYDYISALYAILARLNEKYPQLIIENCASGGGRFDLGMAYYTSCGWASDNTNPLSRARIQRGVSYGYPLSFTLNHVAASPGHQTRRASDIKDRINTAFLGVFGVQADISVMSEDEADELRQAVSLYKVFRKELYDSTVYRLSEDSDGYVIMQTLSQDKKSGFLFLMREKFDTVTQLPVIRLKGLEKDKCYRIKGDSADVCASGETLEKAGLVLPQNYQGAETSDGILNLTDGKTLLLRITQKECL